MKVYCEKYPQLEVHDLKVKFVDSEAEVDEAVAAKLVAMNGFGIRASEGDAPESDSDDSGEGDAPDGGSDELSALKAEADALEIKYHPNTGAEKLRAKIAEAKAAQNQ